MINPFIEFLSAPQLFCRSSSIRWHCAYFLSARLFVRHLPLCCLSTINLICSMDDRTMQLFPESIERIPISLVFPPPPMSLIRSNRFYWRSRIRRIIHRNNWQLSLEHFHKQSAPPRVRSAATRHAVTCIDAIGTFAFVLIIYICPISYRGSNIRQTQKVHRRFIPNYDKFAFHRDMARMIVHRVARACTHTHFHRTRIANREMLYIFHLFSCICICILRIANGITSITHITG